MKISSCALAICLLFSGLTLSAKSLHHFQLRVNVPAGDPSCAVEAQKMAERLLQGASILEAEGLCVSTTDVVENGQTYHRHNLLLKYTSEAAVELSETRLPLHSGEASTIYPQYANCLNDRQTQLTAWQFANHQEALFSSCEAVASESRYGFRLLIHGLGPLEKQLFQFQDATQSRLAENEAWNRQASRFLMAEKAQIVKQQAGIFFYYASQPVSLLTKTLADLKLQAQCEQQISLAENMFLKLGATGLSLHCHPAPWGGFNLDVMSLVSVSLSSDLGATSPAFSRFDQCLTERAWREQAALENGSDFLASFCSRTPGNGDQYQIHTFTSY